MKSFVAAFLFFLSFNAFSEITEVKVTSFRGISNTAYDRGAELCGFVKAKDEKLIQIIVTVDPRQNPAKYSGLTDPQGNFCLVVSTYTGQANVTALAPLSGAQLSALGLQTWTQGAVRP